MNDLKITNVYRSLQNVVIFEDAESNKIIKVMTEEPANGEEKEEIIRQVKEAFNL